MKHVEQIVAFVKNNQGRLDPKVNLKTNLELIAHMINSLTVRHSDLSEVFIKHGVDFHLSCPECDSPILLEMGSCPYCNENLIERPAKEEPKPLTKKEEKILDTFQNTEEEIDELMSIDEEDERVEAKTKFKKKDVTEAKEVKKDKFKKKGEEKVIEDTPVSLEELEGEYLPTEEEVLEMDESQLELTVMRLKLKLDTPLKSIKGIKKMRKAVNEAIDLLVNKSQNNSEEEIKVEKVVEKKSENDSFDIDLDDISLEDDDLSIDDEEFED